MAYLLDSARELRFELELPTLECIASRYGFRALSLCCFIRTRVFGKRNPRCFDLIAGQPAPPRTERLAANLAGSG